MKTRITIGDAILKGLPTITPKEGKEKDMFSLIRLTEFVCEYRGKWVTDGSVSRELRRFNEETPHLGWVLKWEVVKGGVYRIKEFHKYEPSVSMTWIDLDNYEQKEVLF